MAEKKSTITEAHTLAALGELGFGHYAAACQAEDGRADGAGEGAAAGGRKKGKGKRKLKQPDHGLSPEELLRQQQALFAGAAASFGAGGAGAAPPGET